LEKKIEASLLERHFSEDEVNQAMCDANGLTLVYQRSFRLCLRVWRRNELMVWKKEGVSGRNKGHWDEGLWGFIFLHLGELKNCIGGEFGGLREFI